MYALYILSFIRSIILSVDPDPRMLLLIWMNSITILLVLLIIPFSKLGCLTKLRNFLCNYVIIYFASTNSHHFLVLSEMS